MCVRARMHRHVCVCAQRMVDSVWSAGEFTTARVWSAGECSTTPVTSASGVQMFTCLRLSCASHTQHANVHHIHTTPYLAVNIVPQDFKLKLYGKRLVLGILRCSIQLFLVH